MSYRHRAKRTAQACAIFAAAVAGICAGLDTDTLMKQAANYQPWLVETRRTLHSNPELMYEEHETSAFIRKALDKMNIVYR